MNGGTPHVPLVFDHYRGLFPDYRQELQLYRESQFIVPESWELLMSGLHEAEALAAST